MTPPRWRRLPALLCALLLGVGVARAEDALPAPFQAVLLLKALAYDQALKARTPSGTVRVMVLFRADVPESRDTANAVLEALKQAGPAGVAGLPLETRGLAFSTLPSLEAALLAPQATALWVAPGLQDQLAGIEVIARRHAVMTAGGGEASARAGLTLGLASKGGKPQLFVNLGSARAEGVKLDSGLLRLAQVIP